MPIHEYKAKDPQKGCVFCRDVFERIEGLDQKPLKCCPQCGCPIYKIISVASVGASKSGCDDRAKHAGFHKLKKISHGEYEKQY